MSTKTKYGHKWGSPWAEISDKDGDTFRMSYLGPDEHELLLVSTVGSQITRVDPVDLINIIAKVAGLSVGIHEPAVKDEPESEPGPEDHWINVVPAPARAALVTPEFIESLPYTGNSRLWPLYNERTGRPEAVVWRDREQELHEIQVGDYVVLRPGKDPQAMWSEHFHGAYREVSK